MSVRRCVDVFVLLSVRCCIHGGEQPSAAVVRSSSACYPQFDVGRYRLAELTEINRRQITATGNITATSDVAAASGASQ